MSTKRYPLIWTLALILHTIVACTGQEAAPARSELTSDQASSSDIQGTVASTGAIVEVAGDGTGEGNAITENTQTSTVAAIETLRSTSPTPVVLPITKPATPIDPTKPSSSSPSSISSLEPTAENTIAPPTLTRKPTATPVPTSSVVPGWLTYENGFLGYHFSYPPEAHLRIQPITGFPPEEQPKNMTSDEYLEYLQSIYPDGLCVGVTYQAAYIIFVPSSEQLEGYIHPCGITGTGDAHEFRDEEQSLIIDGRQVAGMTTRLFGSEGNWRGEFSILNVNDELEIHYGSAGNSTHEEFLAAQETMMQIIMSLRLE